MLFAFSGLKGSGKDTAANVLIKEYGFTKISFADPVREMALAINPVVSLAHGELVRLTDVIDLVGWDYAKRNSPEIRRLLQVIGTEAVRGIVGENTWVEILAKRYPDITSPYTRYVITDCRFPNEVEFVRNNGGLLVWISRPGVFSDGHASESTDIADLATATIYNHYDVETLEQSVRNIASRRGLIPIEHRITE